jgi:hypothetical protein
MTSFSNFSAPQLRECAKHFGVKKCSKMKKGELAQLLSKKLKVMKNGEVRPRGRGVQKKIKGGEIEDDEFDVGEIDNFYDEIPLPLPGDKKMAGIINRLNDPSQYFEEDPDRGNPNFVENPQNDPLMNIVSDLPVLQGKEKQAVDMAGNNLDNYLSGPFKKELILMGVPPETADALARFAKPYQATKDALKMLKVTSRSGAVRSGVRSKFMSDVLMNDPEIKAIMMKKKKTTQEENLLKRVAGAALLVYDLQFPESEETKYAKFNDKPPYNSPDLKTLEQEFQRVAQDLSRKEDREKQAKNSFKQIIKNPKKDKSEKPETQPQPPQEAKDDFEVPSGLTPEEEQLFREIMGGQLGRSVLGKIQKLPLPVPKKRGRKKLVEKNNILK